MQQHTHTHQSPVGIVNYWWFEIAARIILLLTHQANFSNELNWNWYFVCVRMSNWCSGIRSTYKTSCLHWTSFVVAAAAVFVSSVDDVDDDGDDDGGADALVIRVLHPFSAVTMASFSLPTSMINFSWAMQHMPCWMSYNVFRMQNALIFTSLNWLIIHFLYI